ncbi:hypothetical protein [Companilactobacillus mishanensis]|uniref:Uncharacterized protein n=1 Tax=Companilactobacillus mishanensis TaxID=2486008 RepID=A0A5P0ZKP7_9LACO|nr:hypothetical protein [Companilactobacillus mishanensis]MQS53555.1 hypothetical protein [Companilactobacillus mishanensis]
MKKEKKNNVFQATFKESLNLVDDKFMINEAIKNYKSVNILKKILGMSFMLFSFSLLNFALMGNGLSLDFFAINISSSNFDFIMKVSSYFYLICVVLIVLISLVLSRKFYIFMMFFYLVFVFEFIVGFVFLITFSIGIYSILNWGTIVPMLYLLLIITFLIIFIYNKRQSTLQVLFQSKSFYRVADDLTKKMAQYSAPTILVIMAIKWIMSFGSESGDFSLQIGRVVGSISVPLIAVASVYFGFSYCYYNMFLSYYYLNKYKDEFNLENISKESEMNDDN